MAQCQSNEQFINQVRLAIERAKVLAITITWKGEWQEAKAMKLQPVVTSTVTGFVPGYEYACKQLPEVAIHVFAHKAESGMEAAKQQALAMVSAMCQQIDGCVQPPQLPEVGVAVA